MRIRIVHETRYRYEWPVRGVIQHLRLAPRDHDGQHVLSWRIEPDMDGRLQADEDGFGNLVHVFSGDGPVEALTIRVTGEVETTDTAGLVSGAVERVPDAFYLRDTELTQASDPIRRFAQDSTGEAGGDMLATLHRLLAATHDTVAFDTRSTETTTSAAEAFRLRRGVCQDLSHVFVSAARHIGIPARYVSGYFHRNDGIVDQEATHAWAEARVPNLGWVGFDPANGICTTDAHVRIAVALDYLGAAPVRGSRRGGGAETLDVKLRVDTAQRQSQSQG